MGKLCCLSDEQPDEGELLSPCRCDGSVKCTHQPCLIKWISERGCWSCELCYYKYHVIAISTKNPLQWQAISLTVIEKVQIAAAILGSLFLIASISWLIWSTFSPSAKWQRQDLLFQICYGMYGFMDIVCIEMVQQQANQPTAVTFGQCGVDSHHNLLNAEKLKELKFQAFYCARGVFSVSVANAILAYETSVLASSFQSSAIPAITSCQVKSLFLYAYNGSSTYTNPRAIREHKDH
ncbi:E3 ubiquitin-protein ligase MARCH4 [Willisornis vidua]|uniref:RING-type E3 ubiquitin transferase n=1 Tax=Willisornis vidua TaxID=1566151 RepID=A0ABQ9CM12_9PASS|nr:E3 ubiquitin-protein ligase MARCH4 [Willisornis vidua]